MTGPLTLFEDGETRDLWRYPDIPPEHETPTLEPGEIVVHVAYYSRVTFELRRRDTDTWDDVWSSPETATTTVTDRRLVVGCRQFLTGSTYIGFGVGAAVALGANAVSRVRAKAKTRHRCLVLQLRHEWISHVLHTANPTGWQGRLARLDGSPDQRVGVVAWDRGDRWRLLFSARRPGVDAGLASFLADTVVRSRLRHPHLLREDDLGRLRAQVGTVRVAADPGTTEALYIPGARTIGFNPATAGQHTTTSNGGQP